MKKLQHAISKHKRTRVATLISDKTDFKTKCITRNKEILPSNENVKLSGRHNYLLYVPNNRASKYSMQKLTELRRKKQTILQSQTNVRDTLLASDTIRHKFSKDLNYLNYIISHLALAINSYKHYAQDIHSFNVYIMQSPRQSTFWAINFKQQEENWYIFDHIRTKLETNSNKKSKKIRIFGN